MPVDELHFRIGPRWTRETFAVPDDPLGELSDLEMGLLRYAVEENAEVTVAVGEDEWRVLLFPDISALVLQLAPIAQDLERGVPVELSLPESQLVISFGAGDAAMVRHFGGRVAESPHTVDRSQVAGELRRFQHDVLGRAASDRYVDQADVAEFLARSGA
ncbi:MAG TPA: hypothetical protein VKB57_11370 [Acidimicrobiales bacterium]|nr:hypothetical protein [Acidimicrobiales bacterium]